MKTTSDNIIVGGSFTFYLSVELSLTSLRDRSVFLGLFFLGCASNRIGRPPIIPTPLPTPPVTPPTSPDSKPRTWLFSYTVGTANYTITRKAVIESVDSASERKTSTNVTHEIVTLQSMDSILDVVAVVDTFTTTTDNHSPAPLIQVPTQVLGSFSLKALTLKTSDDSCSQSNSVLATDLYNLLIPFPSPLTIGISWKDTVDVRGCQAGLTTASHVTRSFTVTGEVAGDPSPLVVITRVDSAQFQGEGGLEQHRISVHASGTGTAIYHLNTETGQVVHLSINQILTFDITTQPKRQQFRQETVEDFELVSSVH